MLTSERIGWVVLAMALCALAAGAGAVFAPQGDKAWMLAGASALLLVGAKALTHTFRKDSPNREAQS